MGPNQPGPVRAARGVLLPGHHDHRLLGLVIVVLVIAAIAALVSYLVLRVTERRPPRAPAAPPPPYVPAGGPAGDQALAQLRLRYARGDISRSDFLQATADLGGPPPPATGEPG